MNYEEFSQSVNKPLKNDGKKRRILAERYAIMKVIAFLMLASALFGCAVLPETRHVPIPKSKLSVTVPYKWGDSKLYSGGGYKSITVNPIHDEYGCCTSPDFNFEYKKDTSLKAGYEELLERIDRNSPNTEYYDVSDSTLGGRKAYMFTYDGEEHLSYADFTHGYRAITVKNIFVEVGGGILVCTLTGNKHEHDEFKEKMLAFCSNSVSSHNQ